MNARLQRSAWVSWIDRFAAISRQPVTNGISIGLENCAAASCSSRTADGLRQENDRLRVTCICPGVVESELADTITDPLAAEAMAACWRIALHPQAIADAILASTTVIRSRYYIYLPMPRLHFRDLVS